MNPYLEIVIASLIFGSAGAFVKILHLPPTTLTFFRLAIPTVLLFIYLSLKGVKLFPGKNKLILTASFINAVRLFFFFAAFSFATLSNATLALATGPALAVLYSSVFLKEKISRKKLLLMCLSITGLIILYSNQSLSLSNKTLIGMSLALLSSALYNLTLVIYKKELTRFSPTEIVFYQNFLGAFLFLPFLFLNKPFPSLWQISLASTSQFLLGVLAFVFYFSALRKIHVSSVAIATFDDVISIAVGVTFFKDILTTNMVVGGVMVLLASALISRQL